MSIDRIKEEYLRTIKFKRKNNSMMHEVFNVKISIKNQEKLKEYLQLHMPTCSFRFVRKDGKCFIYTNKENELRVRKFLFYQLLKIEQEFEFDQFELNCNGV